MKNRGKQYETGNSDITLEGEDEIALFKKYALKKTLEYESWPLMIWVVGITIIIISLVIFYKLLFGHFQGLMW
jgi:hypothetical protein